MRLAVILILLALAACGRGVTSESENLSQQTARGLIRSVEARSLLEVDTLTLEVQGGDILVFESRGKRFAGFSPSHLRDHMLQGLSLEIVYHRDGEALVIDELTD